MSYTVDTEGHLMRRFALAGLAALTFSATVAYAQRQMVVREHTTESGEKKPEKSNEFVPDKQANPDPKSLEVPAEIGAKAKAFVAQLGSGIFRDREIAQRELAKIGRQALPAMLDAITNNPEPEVSLRIETLLPRAEAEDMTARVNCFLLDTESKFEHVLPGWKKFQGVAGSDKAARKIFAEALKSKQSHAMLLAAERGSTDDAGQLLSYYVAKLQGVNYQRDNEDTTARTPKTGELAVALFLEGQFSDKRININMPGQWGRGGYYTVMNHIHGNTDFSNAVNGQKTENTAVIRKLMVQWMDTRETLQGLTTAYQQANSILRDQPKAALKYAAKILTVQSGQNDYHNKQNAIQALGSQGGKEYIVQMTKSFDDTNRMSSFGQGNTPDADIEIRDYVLATVIQLADLKPEDFGMTRYGDVKTKLWTYNNFYFKDDRPAAERNPADGRGRPVRVRPVEEKKDPKKEEPKDPKKEEKLTADDRRKIAFKKWEDWAKTGLDKDGKVIKKEEPKKDEVKKDEVKKDETAKEKPVEKPAPKKDIEKSEKK